MAGAHSGRPGSSPWWYRRRRTEGRFTRPGPGPPHLVGHSGRVPLPDGAAGVATAAHRPGQRGQPGTALVERAGADHDDDIEGTAQGWGRGHDDGAGHRADRHRGGARRRDGSWGCWCWGGCRDGGERRPSPRHGYQDGACDGRAGHDHHDNGAGGGGGQHGVPRLPAATAGQLHHVCLHRTGADAHRGDLVQRHLPDHGGELPAPAEQIVVIGPRCRSPMPRACQATWPSRPRKR